MTDEKELFKQRREMVNNVFAFRHNKRVPNMSNFWTWPILDGGYKFHEALYDYDLLMKLNEEFIERYQFDVAMDMLTRNPFRVSDALGGGVHHIDASDESISATAERFLRQDEYQEYVDNPDEAYWTKIFQRYCKPGITLDEMKKAVEEFYEFGAYCGRANSDFVDNHGGIMFYGVLIQMPADYLSNHLRGIADFPKDIRRVDPGLMKAMMDKIWEVETLPLLMPALEAEDAGTTTAPLSGVPLVQAMLSTKQFEELFWPYFKKFVDLCVEHDKTISIFCEAEMLRFADFLDDIPKGTMLMQLEQDDIFAFRKRLPNIAISGGMPAMMLGHDTPEECVDYAKKLIDGLGDGYMFSQDKMMSYRNDAKRENLLAVNEFVRNYEC